MRTFPWLLRQRRFAGASWVQNAKSTIQFYKRVIRTEVPH